MQLFYCYFKCQTSVDIFKLISTNLKLQANLVCSFPLDSLPCEEAPLFYDGPDSINSKFGEKTEYDEDY